MPPHPISRKLLKSAAERPYGDLKTKSASVSQTLRGMPDCRCFFILHLSQSRSNVSDLNGCRAGLKLPSSNGYDGMGAEMEEIKVGQTLIYDDGRMNHGNVREPSSRSLIMASFACLKTEPDTTMIRWDEPEWIEHICFDN